MMFSPEDLCDRTEDGSLGSLRRKDDQVEVKGFRVERHGVAAVIESDPSPTTASALETSESRSNGQCDEQTLVCMEMLESPSPKPIASSSASISTASACSLDLEKGILEVSNCQLQSNDAFGVEGSVVKYELPSKKGFHGLRWLRHRFFSLYRRFFSLVIVGNLIAFAMVSWQSWDRGSLPIPDLATAAASNLLVAVAMRQDHVINFLFGLATRVPTWMPLDIRRQCARVYHIGGIHSGAAISATMWWLVLTGAETVNYINRNEEFTINTGTMVLGYLVMALFTAIVAMAHPKVRVKLHDQFEATHRFAGWAATALVWAHLIVATDSLRPDTVLLGVALATYPAIYLMALITLGIALSWLRLRRVDVRPEPLSSHAVRLHLSFDIPTAGKTIRVADSPMRDWHAFAAINRPGQKGFSIIVSNAGDWTGKTIDTPPRQLWTRGSPASGVLRIVPLFRKVILVATGSGIGPCLPILLDGRVPTRVLWSASHPRDTFSQEIVDDVMRADPKAIIWNTRTKGKPDLVGMAYQMMMTEGDAEAVCIISNRKVTQTVVYQLEARGIPAFGAIFDS